MNSIYFQLLKLLVVSAAVAVLLFLVLLYSAEYLIDRHYYDSDYERKQNRNYIEELQQYVDENDISSDDSRKLDKWIKQQKMILIYIYKDDTCVFDPMSRNNEELPEDGAYSSHEFYEVKFAYGDAEVEIFGLHAYKAYTYTLIADILVSFILFLVLALLGIKRKMNYISRLSEEVSILEGGSLDYEVTVKGNDELAVLAEGLDNMRRSFKQLMEQNNRIVMENQKIITELSHDIKTPVTSIMLYTEILKQRKYKDRDQLEKYINKIDYKVHRLKQLTDCLFEYSLVTENTEVEMEPPEQYKFLFYDLFSETCNYLQQKGFDVMIEVEWNDTEISICSGYIDRIMGNISSNIIKYADPKKPVILRSVYEGQKAGFAFENAKKELSRHMESNNIGIQSIKNMMDKMDGVCEIHQTDERFCITILFS